MGPFSVLREPLPESVFVGPVISPALGAQEAHEQVGDTAALHDGLRITELMFDPSGGPDYEFVEFQNIGTSQLDLTGVRLAGGIDFTFPAMTLDPGEFIVVVDDVEDFQSRYGAAVALGGTFTGNLSDTGELLSLLPAAPDDTPILAFVYDGACHRSCSVGLPGQLAAQHGVRRVARCR